MSHRNQRKELTMRISYASYLSLGIAAAFLVVATVAFPLSTVAGLSLGVGIAMFAAAAGLAARYRRDMPSLAINACIAAVGGWMVVSSQVFAQTTVDDLTFASALAICALAALGLTANELRAERVVHSLEVRESRPEPTSAGRPSAA